MYAGEETRPVPPAAWSQRCQGPSLSNSPAAPADANTELNFTADIQTDIRHFKEARKQQQRSCTKHGTLWGLGGNGEPGIAPLLRGM